MFTHAFGKEIGRLSQGNNTTGLVGTNAIFFFTMDAIKNIPNSWMVKYARIVVHERCHKPDPNRVRITVRGNYLDYPGELTTDTADLTTSKTLLNIIITTEEARYMTIDIKNST